MLPGLDQIRYESAIYRIGLGQMAAFRLPSNVHGCSRCRVRPQRRTTKRKSGGLADSHRKGRPSNMVSAMVPAPPIQSQPVPDCLPAFPRPYMPATRAPKLGPVSLAGVRSAGLDEDLPDGDRHVGQRFDPNYARHIDGGHRFVSAVARAAMHQNAIAGQVHHPELADASSGVQF